MEPCRLRLEDGGPLGGGLALTLSMTFKDAISSREVIYVEIAPRGGWKPRKVGAGQHQLHVTNVRPAGDGVCLCCVFMLDGNGADCGNERGRFETATEDADEARLALPTSPSPRPTPFTTPLAGAVMHVAVCAEVSRSLELQLASGFEVGETLTLTLGLGDKAAKAAWQVCQVTCLLPRSQTDHTDDDTTPRHRYRAISMSEP